MELKTLLDHASMGLARRRREDNSRHLIDRQANEADRLIAAGLAGDLIVVSDNMADALMAIVRSADEPRGNCVRRRQFPLGLPRTCIHE